LPQISSLEQLNAELRAVRTALALAETEHTWEKIAAALQRFTAAIRGGACKFEDEFVTALRDQQTAKRLIECVCCRFAPC
jgi:hypothetical protein